MWGYKEHLDNLGISVLIVTFESRHFASAYRQETSITWPIVIDESRRLYKRYQMHKASFWDLWGPRTWWAYFKQLLKGKLPKKTTGDIHQRGGDVLIDQFGEIKLHHVGTGPADSPSVEAIINIINNSGNIGTRGGKQ